MSEYSHTIRLAAAALLVSGNAAAAEPEIATYLRSALTANDSVRLARAQLDGSESGRTRARSALLPSLSVNASYTRNQYQTEVLQPAGDGTPPETVVTQPRNQLDVALVSTVPLFDGRALAQYATARAGVDVARAQLHRDAQDALFAVALAYYETVAARQVEEAARRSLDVAEKIRERLRIRLEAGTATALLLRRAEADGARCRQTLAEADAAKRAAERRLSVLSGLPQPPHETAPQARLEPQGTPADLAGRALASRPEIAAARAGLEQARARVRDQMWAYAPRLSTTFSQRLSNVEGLVGHQATWQAGVTLQWNLFDGFGREGGVRAARAELTSAEIRLQQASRDARNDVEAALESLAAAREKLEAARKERAASDEAVRLTRELVEAGTRASVDFTEVTRDAFQAEVNEARAQGEVAVSIERLRLAV